jgi:serine/threonine protein kinase
MYFGSCKDILNTINEFYLNEANANEEEDNETEDRADEQIRLCFNEQSLQPITKSVLSALDYLHSKHIIHRCVCPENILISQTGHVYLSGLKFCVSMMEQGSLTKRLHDYPSFSTSAKSADDINDDELGEYVNYLSPELLQQNLSGYNTKSDIYSLAVTLCELANGVNPFVGCEKAQMLYEKLVGFDIGLWDRNILTSPESKKLFASVYATENPKVIASVQRRYFSDKFRNFVDICAQRQSDLRPSASQLLQHIYLKKIKLQNVTSTLRVSVLSDGIIELQKKIQHLQLMKQFNKSESHNTQQSGENIADLAVNNASNVYWEF